MAEEGPGARRLSPHNKDPSLVTSYLPPNLQKAPCHPSKAPAPAACAEVRRDEGVGAGPLLCPPTRSPPRPYCSANARRGAAAAAPSLRGRVSLPLVQGGTRGTLAAPSPSRFILSIAILARCLPAPRRVQTQARAILGGGHNLPVSRGRFTSACSARSRHRARRGGHNAAPRGCPSRDRPPCGVGAGGGGGGCPADH